MLLLLLSNLCFLGIVELVGSFDTTIDRLTSDFKSFFFSFFNCSLLARART